ncbi:MAG: hypothetical protein CSA66_02890 [Proteobacteria bacterium]|nr:MAG: hypothetical protein CSA66_02890 [Pseudomonadota bacterium]
MSKRPLGRAFVALERRELPLALLMCGYFFLVITTFWILKPIKKTAFIGFYQQSGGLDLFGASFTGAQAELLAKVLNMAVAFGATVAFSALARSLRRQQLTYVFSAFSALSLTAFALAGTGGEATVWLLYLFGDLFNTLMVATFFAFLNDSFSPEAAKRAYGVVVLGGVVGGAFGSMFVRAQIEALALSDWLWLGVGLSALIAAVAGAAGRQVAKSPPPEAPTPTGASEPPAGNPAVAGARLLGRSRYLLAIVTMVGVYEVVSTVVDFQFTATVEALVPAAEHGATFSTVYAATNVFAMLFQLLFTSALLRWIGVRGALLVMPVVIAASSLGYMIAPVVLLGGLLSASDNGLNYSLNQSAREALYTVTSRTEKYQAKAFIDMFVQRVAKALAVGLSLLITMIFSDFEDLRWLSLITVGGALVWLFAARAAGREFRARSGQR